MEAVSKPVLSVITVVYNNARDIERTMLSVLNQTYPAIQYIVIDGASTDGTVDIIHTYRDKITLISEPDGGIYDAMNKGLSVATGDYVLFMNSGDELYATDTVSNVFATSANADIYYGETEMIDGNLNSLGQRRHAVPHALTYTSFRYGMSVSHQAFYARRELTAPYNTTYGLSADIDWILHIVKKAKKIVNTHMYVARYMTGGMSKIKHRQSLAERFHVFSNHYGLLNNVFNHLVIAWNLAVYYQKNRKTND